jgi:multidrug efflux pump subunit AcrA (membrane-fusion protein)
MVAVSSLFGMKRLPWVALAAATIGGAGYWLATTPGDLDMACEGKVRPSVRRHVFAPADGKVAKLLVAAEQPVAAGQPLAQLVSPDLEVQIVELLGEQRALEERRAAVGRTLLDQALTRAEKTKAGGELEQIEEQRRTVARKLELKRQQEAELLVTAPVAGVVATWQLEDLLLRRPVQKGQRLLTVQDPSGEWELELFLPEKRFRFVREAWETARREGRPTEVEFILASHPETELKGTIVAIEPHADVFDPEAGNCVRMRAAIDKSQLPDLRDGSLVSARVKCGEASLAYVLSQEALDTVQAKVAFYLPW